MGFRVIIKLFYFIFFFFIKVTAKMQYKQSILLGSLIILNKYCVVVPNHKS